MNPEEVHAINTEIQVLADTLEDMEEARKAMKNRLRHIPEVVSEVAIAGLSGLDESVSEVELEVEDRLRKAFRLHPLRPWQKKAKGIGDKQLPRAIAAIMRPPKDLVNGNVVPGSGISYYYKVELDGSYERIDRTVSALWANCGLAPGQIKRRGTKANWNHRAKMRMWNVSNSCKKSRCENCREQGAFLREAGETGWAPPPLDCTCEKDGYKYRAVYDKARVSWQDREDVSDLHRENHALRRVSKEILKDMFVEAKALGI